MGGGLPNEDCFPIKSMSLKLADGSDLEIDEATTLQALQYGRTPGQYELLKWVMTLLKILHDPPTLRDNIHPGKLEVVITSGAQDGLYKICEALVEEDDTIFTEAPTCSSFMAAIRPFGCKLIPIEMDENGLIPEKLSMVLSDHLTRNNGKLKFLYCVPNGGNPSGFRYTEDRKRKIYELARKYNLLIVEYDAYFFLEIKPYMPSFLSMDVDGRVIRIDTFSKSIAPGLRTAFLSGPKPIVEKVIMAMQASNSSCAVTSQVILLAILKRMGHDGYLQHCETLADFYKRRRDLCIKAAEKHLNGLAEWHTPSGGMFLWIKIRGTKDACKIVDEKLKSRRILMVPGVCFNTDERVSSAHIRISYSKVSEKDMHKAFQALAEELRELAISK
ncbi:hypothetical protein CHS0354_017170 [Potamilus streckersoni]|uniref:Aminotransferase class I/classII large domain-containing protein n=1 Tax=Potamilus streckersoni TaxID=2493646 RepID=A0AAE0W5E4_9BIVA|nr:hypothetical protein CHS0354_017170 [Potamilus streckersoni]